MLTRDIILQLFSSLILKKAILCYFSNYNIFKIYNIHVVLCHLLVRNVSAYKQLGIYMAAYDLRQS